MTAVSAENTKILVNVGAVVDVANAPNRSLTGMIYLSSIKMALSDLYASHAHFKTRLVLTNRSCKGSVVGAASAALDLMKNDKVKAILGPVTSMQTSFVVNLGDQAQVPILSFSATSPSLTSLRSSYFFLMAETDLYQVKAISSIVKNFGWRQVIPIYVDNTYGQSVIPYLIDALQEVDAHVPYQSVIPPSATDDQIEKELHNLIAMETSVFLVHMMTNLSSRIFVKAKELGMMSEGYVWIMTNEVGNRLWTICSDARIMNSMQGVLGVETHVPRSKELQEVKKRWKRQFRQDNPAIVDDVDLDAFGLRAYDAAFALALAVEQVGNKTSFGFENRRNASSTDLDTFKVSQYGPKLAHALSSTTFKGLAGEFKLKDRKLQSTTFRIVNVNGDGVRTIAFWTPENGLAKTLNSTRPCTVASTSNKCNLGPVLWPGDSHSVPKGWEIPTKGNKLRIGVPLKSVFTEFVNVTKNSSSNTTNYLTGFGIDIFKAALKELPYDLLYELIPFENSDGQIAGTFDALVYQVYLKKFDAVVGEITIRENRSLYVDFTMPYTESGVVMVVPIRYTARKNSWMFLKPLTWDLWLTTLCFFVYIGFVIWVLEHGVNEDFRGPPLHQVGTSFWFSFSTMVFSPKRLIRLRILETNWFS